MRAQQPLPAGALNWNTYPTLRSQRSALTTDTAPLVGGNLTLEDQENWVVAAGKADFEKYRKHKAQFIQAVAALLEETVEKKLTHINTTVLTDDKFECCLLYTSPSPRD